MCVVFLCTKFTTRTHGQGPKTAPNHSASDFGPQEMVDVGPFLGDRGSNSATSVPGYAQTTTSKDNRSPCPAGTDPDCKSRLLALGDANGWDCSWPHSLERKHAFS
eukprot:1363829-Rhodomonas_salina.2